MAETNFRALVHELQVHQIELETQNEELHRAEAAAQESSNKYCDLFDFAPTGYFMLDENGRILEVNLAGAALLAQDRRTVVKKRFAQFVAVEDRTEFAEYYRRVLHANARQSDKVTIHIDSEHMIHALVEGIAVRDKDGNVTGCRMAVIDISKRERAEELLRKSETRYRNLFYGSPNPLREADYSEVKKHFDQLRTAGVTDFRQYFHSHPEAVRTCAAKVKVLGVNQAALDLHQATSTEDLLAGLEVIFTNETYDTFREDLIAIANGTTDFMRDVTVRTLQDEKRYVQLRWVTAPGCEETLAKVYVSYIDMTQHKRADEALRESEEKYRDLVQNANSIIIRWDMDGNFTFFNEFAETFFGFSQSEVIGKNVMGTIVPHTDRSGNDLAAMVEDIKRHPDRYKTNVNENVRKNGERVWISWSNKAVRDKHGKMVEVLAVGNDVTKQKRAEEALRLTNFCVQHAGDGIFWIDSGGRIVFANQKASEVLEYSCEALQAMTVFDIDPIVTQEHWEAHWGAILQEKSFVFESCHRTKTGRIFPVEISVNYVTFDGKEYNCAIARDISERRKAEERQARTLERLESVNLLQEKLLLPGTLEEKVKQIADTAVMLLDLDFCRVWIARPGDLCNGGCIHASATELSNSCCHREQCLHLITSGGRYTHTDGAHRRVPFGACKIGRIANGEENEFLTNTVTTDPQVVDHAWARQLGLVSFAGYKLDDVNGKPLGVLAAFAKHSISEEDHAFLSNLAETTSKVILDNTVEEELRQKRQQAEAANRARASFWPT